MSLDQAPSSRPAGGWNTPGLSGDDMYRRGGTDANGKAVSWASAKANSARVNGYTNRDGSSESGFFRRSMRRLSTSLPFFSSEKDDRYAEKEKLRQRGAQHPKSWSDLPKKFGFLASRRRKVLATLFLVVSLLFWWFSAPLLLWYRRHPKLGGGSKYVIVLGANEGGGVIYWKGAKEWAIERDSLKNKRNYASRWGYELDIVDMSTKKRYAHEWRESWERVDEVRNSMRRYPDAEWFWWLDLNTVIMEPGISLQQHIFNDLKKNTYRDINHYNPLGLKHPPNGTSGDPNAPKYVNYLDKESTSAEGDGNPKSIDMIIAQDCGGFNLGSFMVRRSAFSDRLLDIWWDPVFYEQKHMEWDHHEQDALEYVYTNQPWSRSHIAFIPQRKINAFPHGACGDDLGIPDGGCKKLKVGDNMRECGIQGIHYQQKERDFTVNCAGCGWDRDCWNEMYNYRQLSNRLNRSRWQKFKDWLRNEPEEKPLDVHIDPPTEENNDENNGEGLVDNNDGENDGEDNGGNDGEDGN